MNNKEFTSEISRRTGLSEKECGKMIEAIGLVLGELLYSGNRLNLPGFGTFSTELKEEEIKRDLQTGKRMLYPPSLEIKFAAASSLTTKLN